MASETPSATPDAAVVALVALFHGELAEVRFPGVDAGTLDAAMAAVATQLDEVHRLWRAHQDAMAVLREQQRALREHARQALAYARVFAASDAELSARLDQIGLDAPPAATSKKKRGRRRKSVPAPQLPLEESAAAAAVPG